MIPVYRRVITRVTLYPPVAEDLQQRTEACRQEALRLRTQTRSCSTNTVPRGSSNPAFHLSASVIHRLPTVAIIRQNSNRLP